MSGRERHAPLCQQARATEPLASRGPKDWDELHAKEVGKARGGHMKQMPATRPRVLNGQLQLGSRRALLDVRRIGAARPPKVLPLQLLFHAPGRQRAP
eukprot:6870593-Alexandrium_andersonii.AAC.1